MTDKNFRRLYLTIDEDVMVILGLDPTTVTATDLRLRLREIAIEMGGVLRPKPRATRKDAGFSRREWEQRELDRRKGLNG